MSMDNPPRMEAEREFKQMEVQLRHAFPAPGAELLDPIGDFEVDVNLPGTPPRDFP